VSPTIFTPAEDPFEVRPALHGALSEQAWNLARPVFDWAVGFGELRRVYAAASREASVEGFLARALLELGVEWSANDLDLSRIPRKGGCVVVANHPFGGIEGIVLASMLRASRKDVKVVANQLLWRLEAMREVLLPVDVYGGSVATQHNLPRLRAALRHLKSGGVLAVFPSGEVAHFSSQRGAVAEAEWNPSVAWLARVAQAPVVPVHFAGQASVLVQALGLLHPGLRTALLPRELLRQRGRCLRVRVGAPISQAKLDALGSDALRVDYLRQRTLVLGAASPKPRRPVFSALTPPARLEPLAPPLDSSLIAREIEALPESALLVKDHDRCVYVASAQQIPWTLREIGRLREQTFREAREGTGRSFDLDDFDRSYLHLFSFDHKDQQLVGAYRLGLSDRVPLPSGLYTSTLFTLDPELFRRTGPAIEMGRSFVCTRYQKSPAGLFLLWRGIGRFLAQNSQYRVLFGPVSISADYSMASRELMVDYSSASDRVHPLNRFVRARMPFARNRRTTVFAGLGPGFQQLLDIEEVSQMVADVEPDQKGVPILLRQYLRLGGRMLGFNLDPSFSGVLDGLVLVDLAETDLKILSRYLGAEAAASFRARHAAPRVSA